MNDDNTISNPAIELTTDDLACARGGLPVDPSGDPGGPTGRPDFLGPDAFRIPREKVPDLRIVYPPPYQSPPEKEVPGQHTPPIYPFPIA